MDLDCIANIIWGQVWLYGKFKPADKNKALRFLRRHAKTYLNNPYFSSALAFAERCEIPPGAQPRFGPPGLMSDAMCMPGKSHTADDVSDRIWSANLALKRAGVCKRSRRIASALQLAGIELDKRGGSPSAEWSWEDVRERIKKHRRRQCAELERLGLSDESVKQALAKRLALRVDHWINSYKTSLTFRAGHPAASVSQPSSVESASPTRPDRRG
jgi:hypothetical protein